MKILDQPEKSLLRFRQKLIYKFDKYELSQFIENSF